MKHLLASQYPRRGRGRVLTAQDQGRRLKLSPNIPGFGRPVGSRNSLKTPKENFCKRWPRLTSATVAQTKFREFQQSRWMCQPGLTFANCFANGRKRLTEHFFPLHWHGSMTLGASARRPMSHTGLRRLASANRMLPVLKRSFLWQYSA